MVVQEGDHVVIDRHICGANLAKRWSRPSSFLMGYVACGRLTPFGLIGPNQEGMSCFIRDVDVSRTDYITDLDPWNGRKVICFDLDEVEALERVEDVVAPSPAAQPPRAAPTISPSLPSSHAGPTPFQSLVEAQARIADLERQLDEAREERDVWVARAEDLKAGQGKASKTAPGLKAAQSSRVEEWKGYAVVMAKVAYDCGLEDRREVTRPDYEKLVKRHGKLSSTALELLRLAFPDGVTKTSGGPASQG